jgi:hypothetical protein
VAYGEAERKKALRLVRSGLSPEAAAAKLAREGLEVTERTIRRWARADRGSTNGAGTKAAPAPPAAPVAASPLAKPQAAPAGPSPAELEAEAAEVLDAADRAHERLDALHEKLCARLDDEIKLAEPDMRTLAPIAKLSLEVAVTLAKTRPPVAVRPEDDPTNLDAAAALVERIGKLVEAREQAAR